MINIVTNYFPMNCLIALAASVWRYLLHYVIFCLPLQLFGSLNSDVTQLKKELDDLVDAIIENFFEPEKNKLQPKAE